MTDLPASPENDRSPDETFDADAVPLHLLPHIPVNLRSVSLAVLAGLALIYTLSWAADVFVPVVLGLLFSYALAPPVDWLERRRMPRAVGAAIVMLALLGGLGATIYSLADDATKLVELLPDAATKLRHKLRAQSRGEGTIDKVQQAAAQLEQAADDAGKSPAAKRGVTRVQIEKPAFNVKDYLLSGTIGLVTFGAQTVVVLFITYFLLAAGDTFRRKMVKLAGPTLAQKRITVQALDEITGQVQRYLQVQVFTSALVGIATGLAFGWIGLQQAAVWGIVAGVLNLIPYFGSLIVAAGSALAAFMQFGGFDMALLVGGTAFFINSVEGYALTPWLTSRANRMNPLAVFVGVLFWGWIWGIWGLLLGVPVMAVIKSVCDRIDELKAVGEMLGD